MAYTQEQLDALRAALASGVLRVQYEDRAITYHSVADLMKAIQVIEAALADPITSGVYRRSVVRFSKGHR